MSNWNKAGRPRSKSQGPSFKKLDTSNKVHETSDDADWTKEELAIIAATKKDAYVMLAIAVVKQWILDGKPQCDADCIRYWLSVIKEFYRSRR